MRDSRMVIMNRKKTAAALAHGHDYTQTNNEEMKMLVAPPWAVCTNVSVSVLCLPDGVHQEATHVEKDRRTKAATYSDYMSVCCFSLGGFSSFILCLSVNNLAISVFLQNLLYSSKKALRMFFKKCMLHSLISSMACLSGSVNIAS